MTSESNEVHELIGHARDYAARARETDVMVLAALLADDGFSRGPQPNLLTQWDTGVCVAVTVNGYRITFSAPDAHNRVGIIEFVNATTFGVIEQVTRALHRAVLAPELVTDTHGRPWQRNPHDGTYATTDDEQTGWSLAGIRRKWGPITVTKP